MASDGSRGEQDDSQVVKVRETGRDQMILVVEVEDTGEISSKGEPPQCRILLYFSLCSQCLA